MTENKAFVAALIQICLWKQMTETSNKKLNFKGWDSESFSNTKFIISFEIVKYIYQKKGKINKNQSCCLEFDHFIIGKTRLVNSECIFDVFSRCKGFL